METVVLLNRPVWIVTGTRKGVNKISEVLGFKVTSRVDMNNIEKYLEYLAGASLWCLEGNTVAGSEWITLDGEVYFSQSPYIKDFNESAREWLDLSCRVIRTNKILDEKTRGMLEGQFIISWILYDNLMEYGAEVDVQNEHTNRQELPF